MLEWIQRLVGLAPQEQLVEIESRELSLEDRIERIIRNLGNYRRRNPADLEDLITDLSKVLEILDKIIFALENIGGAERARELRRRLRNNATRAGKALQQLKDAS
jgi:hypothetical protein